MCDKYTPGTIANDHAGASYDLVPCDRTAAAATRYRQILSLLQTFQPFHTRQTVPQNPTRMALTFEASLQPALICSDVPCLQLSAHDCRKSCHRSMPRLISVRVKPSQVWTNWRPKAAATMVVQNIDGKHWEYSILGPHSGIMLHVGRVCQHNDRREGQQTYPRCEW